MASDPYEAAGLALGRRIVRLLAALGLGPMLVAFATALRSTRPRPPPEPDEYTLVPGTGVRLSRRAVEKIGSVDEALALAVEDEPEHVRVRVRRAVASRRPN